MRTCALLTLIWASLAHAQGPTLKSVPIDSVPKETLWSLRADTQGRLFVGGREALLVYEPAKEGGFQRRKSIYPFPSYSDINDIEIRGNDLYVATRCAIYVIPDGVRKREDLKPRKLIWGVPRGDARQGFRALAWGPEGDLYFAVGAEQQQYWTFFCQPADTKVPYHGSGGVFRCKPDGSGLKVVARGLRNVDGLVFDSHWNLFACDSAKGNTGRLLHVTPRAFFDGTLEPMLDGNRTSRIAALSYRDDLLIARGDDLLRLPIKPRGASFQTAEYALSEGKRPGAMTVAHEGRLFAIMDSNQLVMLARTDDPKSQPFEPYDLTTATPEKLWLELNNPAWTRRYRAHIEMTRRGGDFLKLANKKLLDARPSDPAVHHWIWLAAKSELGSLHLLSMVDDADPIVRTQVLRALAEFPEQLRDQPFFTRPLVADDPTVVHAAMSAFFHPKIAWSKPLQFAVERGPARSDDSYLRQTAALLLAEKASRDQLETLCRSINERARLAGVLAVGYRLRLPSAARPLPSHLPLKKFEDESAHVIEYADGKFDLREHGRLGTFTTAEHWKADKQTQEQNLLFKLLRKMREDADETVRAEAARVLELLDGPRIQAPR